MMTRDAARIALLVTSDDNFAAVAREELGARGWAVLVERDVQTAGQILADDPAIGLALFDAETQRGCAGLTSLVGLAAAAAVPVAFIVAGTDRKIPARIEAAATCGCIAKDAGRTAIAAALGLVLKLEAANRRAADCAANLHRHSLVLDQIMDHVTITDLEGRITWVNRAEMELFGKTREELIGQSILDYGEDEGHGASQRQIVELTLRDGRWRGEVVNDAADGTRRIMDCRTRVVRDDDGAAVALCGIATDITARKRIEEELRRNDALLHGVIDSSLFLIQVKDLAGRFIFASQSLVELFGRSTQDELLGRTSHDFLPAVTADRHCENDREAIECKTILRFEETIRTSDGELVFLVSKFPLFDKEGRVYAVCGVSVDITARKNVEEVLKQSERTLRSLFDAIDESVCMLERDGTILAANATFAARMNLPSDEVVGRNVFALLPPELAVPRRAYIEHVFDSGKPCHFEDERKNRWFHHNVYPVTAGDGRIARIVVYANDITSLKQAGENMRRLELQLRQEQKLSAVGTLAGGVAHEINNPLNGIINYAQLVCDHLPPEEHLIREYCTEIIGEGNRITAIVRNLLSFSRQEQSKRSVDDVRTVAGTVIALAGNLLAKDEIRLVTEFAHDVPPVICSAPQIQQVLLNLLTNARDALNEKHPGYHPEKLVRVAASPFSDESGDYVRIAVRDSGPGIPDAMRECVFDPFFTTKDSGHGTGLGLSISFRIVQEHGGRLTFESWPGEGTEFRIDLPAFAVGV